MPEISLEPLCERGEVVEIGMDGLRFTLEETEQFVEKNKNALLGKEDVASLQRSTEGWVAGLQLSTLSQSWRELPGGQDVPFAGAFRKISEYLVEDVLASQPEDVQHFLVQTSILKRFSAPLCDALMGRADSEAMLEYLEEANLFVIPLDKKRHWYRYHSLFARFLRNRLERGRREQTVRLHRAASVWYAAHGELLEAISHGLAAEDPEGAACLMEHCSLEMVMSGQVATVVDWGDGLSMEILARHSYLLLAYGYALLVCHQYEKTAEVIDLLQRTVASPSHPLKLQDELKALRALMLLFQDRVDECEEIVMEEAPARTGEDSLSRGVWLNVASWQRAGLPKLRRVSSGGNS
jgi:LuxR family maltose regulon positive regulatory protein